MGWHQSLLPFQVCILDNTSYNSDHCNKSIQHKNANNDAQNYTSLGRCQLISKFFNLAFVEVASRANPSRVIESNHENWNEPSQPSQRINSTCEIGGLFKPGRPFDFDACSDGWISNDSCKVHKESKEDDQVEASSDIHCFRFVHLDRQVTWGTRIARETSWFALESLLVKRKEGAYDGHYGYIANAATQNQKHLLVFGLLLQFFHVLLPIIYFIFFFVYRTRLHFG